ncbi:PilZ domain-containing protein [Sphingomonas sp. 28-63-12]|uniref:PilZ domain-containing protein n=1 Tax=Sphingomonas sp. 28-63-12 TaxID=1970434 RepID=UPI000BC91B45|nr:MAG: hypothetical protein B7Y47_03845 [Sphingomonas sp. 28-63-12]
MTVAATMDLDNRRGFVERRTGVRQISVFRVGRLVDAGQDQLCVVRDLSATGAMIEVNRVPAVGARVQIDLRSDKCYPATVRWARQRKAGVQFDLPVDIEAVLREERQSIRRRHPRAPRFERPGQVRIMSGRGICEGAIANISIVGVAVKTPDLFAKDEPVVVIIDGLGATHGFARWTLDGETGFRLASPLSYRALADWLDAHAGTALP